METAQPTGIARRRLLRAGLAAAPMLAALKSRTVLAETAHTCIRPSSFSSLAAANMIVSAGRNPKTDYNCYSHGYWKNNDVGQTVEYKKKKFLGDGLGFTYNHRQAYGNKTLLDVLNMRGGNVVALSRHIVGTYLSAVAFGDDNSILTKAQCVDCWNNMGNWSPFPGTTWSLETTLGYFDKIYGNSFL